LPAAERLRPQEIIDRGGEKISPAEVPKRFFFMTSFPHTVKGADDRHRLAAALGLPSQRGLS
jgi:hypothetical protein